MSHKNYDLVVVGSNKSDHYLTGGDKRAKGNKKNIGESREG